MTLLAFVDTETTGLDPDRHPIWEVALILRTDGDPATDTEHHWFLPVDLSTADPYALKLGGYHGRHPDDGRPWGQRSRDSSSTDPNRFAAQFARLTRGAHLVGNVISFDEERLRKLLQGCGQCPEWHYHLIDVEALVAGFFGIHPPWSSEALTNAAGVSVPEDVHEAMADARWARDVYDQVMVGLRDR